MFKASNINSRKAIFLVLTSSSSTLSLGWSSRRRHIMFCTKGRVNGARQQGQCTCCPTHTRSARQASWARARQHGSAPPPPSKQMGHSPSCVRKEKKNLDKSYLWFCWPRACRVSLRDPVHEVVYHVFQLKSMPCWFSAVFFIHDGIKWIYLQGHLHEHCKYNFFIVISEHSMKFPKTKGMTTSSFFAL